MICSGDRSLLVFSYQHSSWHMLTKLSPQIELKLINRYHSTWPAAISVLSGGILNLDALVTHVFPLEKAIEAMEVVADVTKGGIKVQIVDDIDLD
jgi:L-iditol 2-dehydrogenase